MRRSATCGLLAMALGAAASADVSAPPAAAVSGAWSRVPLSEVGALNAIWVGADGRVCITGREGEAAAPPSSSRSPSFHQWLAHPPTSGPAAILLLRLMAGGVFLAEGFLKFNFATLGAGRFTKLGFPWPQFTSTFALAAAARGAAGWILGGAARDAIRLGAIAHGGVLDVGRSGQVVDRCATEPRAGARAIGPTVDAWHST